MAPPIQQQTRRYGQLIVDKFVLIFLLTLIAFQIINAHEHSNVHDEQAQHSYDAPSSSKYNRHENTPSQGVNSEDRYRYDGGSFDFHNHDHDEHFLQQDKLLEKDIGVENGNTEELPDNSETVRYSESQGSDKDRPRHSGQLYKLRAGQGANDAGHILESLDGVCWLKAIATTAVISISPVLLLLLIPLENAEQHKKLQKILLSFATGGLLGDAFFHMIPRAVMSSDHHRGDKERPVHGHSHADGHSHGHDFHSHDMTVGLYILSGVIVFLIAEKFGQFLKYGHWYENDNVNVTPDGGLKSIDNSSPGKKGSTNQQDHSHAEKKNGTKRIENSSPEKKSNTKGIEYSSPGKKNSTKRIQNSSLEKKIKAKNAENSLSEKKSNTKLIENSSPVNKIKAKHPENFPSMEQANTKSVEDSSFRKRKGKGKHTHKDKDRAGERMADTNKEIEKHSEAEQYSKSEHTSEEKSVLSKMMKNIAAVSAAHNPDIKITGYLTLVADFAYNFADGLAIGASFMAGGSIGTVASVTIFLHELSHEIGDFAILVQSGYSKGKAVLLQFITAVGSVLGTLCSLTLQGETRNSTTAWILPFTAGGFIYIALVSVIPDRLEKSRTWQCIKEILAMITGVLLMLLIALYE